MVRRRDALVIAAVLAALLAIVGAGCILTAAYDAGARRGWWAA
jgi:hypothetical protein